jgi:hypothetical protein
MASLMQQLKFNPSNPYNTYEETIPTILPAASNGTLTSDLSIENKESTGL